MQTVRVVLEDWKNMQLLPLMFLVAVLSGIASAASVGGDAGSCCIPDIFSGRMLLKSYDQGSGNDPLDRTLTGMDELQFVVDSAHRRIFGRHEGRTEVGSPFDWKYIFGGNNEVGHEAEMHLHVVDSMNKNCFKFPLETGADIAKFENLCTSLNLDGFEPSTDDHIPDSLKFVLDRDSDEKTHIIVSRDACKLLKTEMTTGSGGVHEAEFLLDDLSNAAEAQRRKFALPSYCDNAPVVHNWPHTSPAFALLGRMFLPGVFSKPCCDFPDLIDNGQPTINAREQGDRNGNSHFDDTEGGRGRQDRMTPDRLKNVLVEVLSAGTSKESQAEKSDVLSRNALIKYVLDTYLQGRDSKEKYGVDRSQGGGVDPSFDLREALLESVVEELINEDNLIPNDPRGFVELKDALIEVISGEENDEQEAGGDDDDQTKIGEFGGDDDDERYFATDDLKVMVLKVLFEIEDGRDDTGSDSEDRDIEGSESSDVNDDADRESEDEDTDRSESNDVDDGNKGELVSAVETLDHIEEDQTGNTNNLNIERHRRSKRHSRRHSRDKKKAKRKDDKKKEKSKVEEDKKKEKSKINEDKNKAKSKSHEAKKKHKMHKALKVIGKITAAIVVGLS